ncbi:unnamed protein product [Nippostrongylus brasiliensis]|uniref:Inner membrane protein n=1 Tax=Nippostrongylus brasiliensis TaxID=27835 RepID=A0A0N4YKJ4_NIPBR|nr:hypothetical protein Q1695_006002 [Nippostrongylus brasiliensis]VDL81225.1 unnamed protein product [Nippostrongylus brasiliensis]
MTTDLASYLADLQLALRNILERRQALITSVEHSVDSETDNATYQSYMHESRVDDAVVEAEILISTLKDHIDEASHSWKVVAQKGQWNLQANVPRWNHTK